MAQLMRRALQRGGRRWLQQGCSQRNEPALLVGAGVETNSWIASRARGTVRFLAANPASSTSASSDAGLLHILRSEIEHESGGYKVPQRVGRGPPKPWTIADVPGKSGVILRRSYGPEEIAVTAMYQSEDAEATGNFNEDEDEEDENESEGTVDAAHFTVSVSKGADQPTLEFSLTGFKGAFTIDHVSYVEDKNDKETEYEGPPFEQLDDELKNQFDDYLSARGINDVFTDYLLELVRDKEEREYLRWLRNVENFVRK